MNGPALVNYAKRLKLDGDGDIISMDNSCSVVGTNEGFVTKEVRTFQVPKRSVFLEKLQTKREKKFVIPELKFGHVSKSDVASAYELHDWTLKLETGASVTIYYGAEIKDLVVNCQLQFLSKGNVERNEIMTENEATNYDVIPTYKCVAFYYGSYKDFWMETTDQLKVIITFTSPLQLIPPENVVYGNDFYVPSFEAFFLSKDLSDISVSCNSAKWPAHKMVLAHCSDVFKRMVQTEMKETQEGNIKLDKFEPRVVIKMLRFVYTGKLDATPEIFIEIFKLAHTYEIKGLKTQMLPMIVNSISLETAPKMHSFGELYDATVIMARALFIAKLNKKKLAKDAKNLKKLTVTYPDFMFKLWNED